MEIKGNFVDIHSRTIFPARIFIESGRIAEISPLQGEAEYYILPGFVDAHIHIESSLLTPENFAPIALSHGAVATVSDPHEIANVCGVGGVNFMIENGGKSNLKFFWTAPSCVPATSFDTSGAQLKTADLDLLFKNEKIVALGEMMNYPGVIFQDPEVMEKCKVSQKRNRVIDGHAPGITGNELRAYISAGISTDHECSTLEEAEEKIKLGMKILIREGSSAKNFEALHSLLLSHPDKVMLCSDDLHAEDLIKGHINLLVKRALLNNIPLFDALRAVSLNPVEHYGLNVGLLRVGDPADFIIVDNVENFNILETWIGGSAVFKAGQVSISVNSLTTVNQFNATPVSVRDLKYEISGNSARVIEVEEGSITTKASVIKMGEDFESTLRQNQILKLFVKDRYVDKNLGKALVKGFGPMKGAIASTISHDSHNIIAVGDSYSDIEIAINLLIETKGGICFVNGSKREVLPLPVAGLMSLEPADKVAEGYARILHLAQNNGCVLKSPLMTLSFLALPVIPSLKLSDKGLFDVDSFQFTELFIS